MSDTIRIRSDLVSLFADNNSELITAQDLRDFLISTPVVGQWDASVTYQPGDIVADGSNNYHIAVATSTNEPPDANSQQAYWFALGNNISVSRVTFPYVPDPGSPQAIIYYDGYTLDDLGQRNSLVLGNAHSLATYNNLIDDGAGRAQFTNDFFLAGGSNIFFGAINDNGELCYVGPTGLMIFSFLDHPYGNLDIGISASNDGTTNIRTSALDFYINGSQLSVGAASINGFSTSARTTPFIVDTAGNVSSGSLSTSSYLHLTPSSAPATAEGTIYWDSGSHTLKVYNGSAWKTVTTT